MSKVQNLDSSFASIWDETNSHNLVVFKNIQNFFSLLGKVVNMLSLKNMNVSDSFINY